MLFTRDPLAGADAPYGEWLPRGQGEDVVSGRHDPLPLEALAEQLPEIHADLMAAAGRLESDACDVQDIEFTVESGKLWLLQTRVAKRSPTAAVRLAVLLEREGLIDSSEALDRVTPDQAADLLRPHIEPGARASAELVASGRPACPGVAAGTVVTDTDEAARRAEDGERVILARPTTDPNDVHAMAVVAGILTELGGATSHAAVVSRELGVPCVVGCGEATLMPLAGQAVTIDAAAGEVLAGELPVVQLDRVRRRRRRPARRLGPRRAAGRRRRAAAEAAGAPPGAAGGRRRRHLRRPTACPIGDRYSLLAPVRPAWPRPGG